MALIAGECRDAAALKIELLTAHAQGDATALTIQELMGSRSVGRTRMASASCQLHAVDRHAGNRVRKKLAKFRTPAPLRFEDGQRVGGKNLTARSGPGEQLFDREMHGAGQTNQDRQGRVRPPHLDVGDGRTGNLA